MFWLSHHHPGEHGRCYQMRGVSVCARCAGTYPMMAVVMTAQFVWHAPLVAPFDLGVGVGLMAPATLDWAFGRFWPQAGTNAWRTFTGLLLGGALGRSLFIHVQRPWPEVLVAQATLVTCAGLPVILAAYWRWRRL